MARKRKRFSIDELTKLYEDGDETVRRLVLEITERRQAEVTDGAKRLHKSYNK